MLEASGVSNKHRLEVVNGENWFLPLFFNIVVCSELFSLHCVWKIVWASESKGKWQSAI